jgi:RHS repeat-associated protein
LAYDTLNRVTSYGLDGSVYATLSYDSFSRVSGVVYPMAKNDVTGQSMKLSSLTRDALQRTVASMFTMSDGKTLGENVALSSQTSTITGYSTSFNDSVTTKTASASYTYDTVGNLKSASVDNWQYTYGFGSQDATTCSATVGQNTNAWKNGNRTSYSVKNTTTNIVTSSSFNCYNNADQLTKSSDAQVGTPTYNDHGSITQLAGAGSPIVFTYDATDQNTKIQQGNNWVEYTKTSGGAVLTKKEYRGGILDKVYRNAGGVMLSCDKTDPTNTSKCGIVDKYIELPGGVSLTLHPAETDPAKQATYSVKNFHGDTALTVNKTGAATSSVFMYDPFGQTIQSNTFSTGNTTLAATGTATDNPTGWAANPSRKTESLFSIPIIQMGARTYLPTLGRFLQVDPIEGGTSNDYAYVNDPINQSDYDGTWGMPKWFKKLPTWAKVCVAVVAAVVAVVAVVAAVVFAPAIAAAVASAGAYIATAAASVGTYIAASAPKLASAGRAAASGASAAVQKIVPTVNAAGQKVLQGVQQMVQAGGVRVQQAVNSASNYIQNGQNILRIGRTTEGAPFRISIGPAPKAYNDLGAIGRALSPIHLHMEAVKAGIEFNWFTVINSAGKQVPLSMRLWGDWQ